jgi:putative flippase GtrA
MSKQLLRFLIAGGLAATVNWLSRFLFSQFLLYEVAVVVAYMFGMATGFFIMRSWVFHAETGAVRRQVITYLIVNLVGLTQTLIVSSMFARFLLPSLGVVAYREAIAHVLGIIAPVFTSFVGHKRATFVADQEAFKAPPTPQAQASEPWVAPEPPVATGKERPLAAAK